ncbi:cardiolipin synthase [Mucilaginibacter boryungensis]|uniref:Cardiolipin synthase n=1 Tax=Mucilaginibacter boryungensis TaxID=768480 RepID=A0ABR9XKD5_9SPHI|nr:cardiolipin synthase [Mucilaginibacter boryungensis]MBE9667465.1 cardiolipin synthase [Mucilaginibacter boryungensis]
MHWYILTALYVLLVVFVCLKVLYDIRSTSKTFAYLLVVIFLPGIGIIIYFAVGANYRKNKIYSKKIINDSKLLDDIRENIKNESEKAWNNGNPQVKRHQKLARLLLRDNSPLTGSNTVKLLLNGEEKFPEVIKALQAAKHHIHMEYYIFENGDIGNQIKDILIQKAAEGVAVRLIYDDFGSRSIRKQFVQELIDGGVEAYPFYKIWFIALSNRTNYRNHRKIIVIDGCTGFVGGINVSDRYINTGKKQVYWRDTHVMINGPGMAYLQNVFICDWNFCAGKRLPIVPEYFCTKKTSGKAIVQIAASGPDSDTPTIMFSLLETIALAQEELLITSPYFIPGESVLDALCIAAMSGVKVKLLVPAVADSALVNAAARSYYGEILAAGAEVYLYQKGFVHAKTVVSDGQLAIIGTANMDHRSFELNFEVNSLIYDNEIAGQLRDVFYNDLKNARQINPKTWARRTMFKQLPEKLCRLLSPLL